MKRLLYLTTFVLIAGFITLQISNDSAFSRTARPRPTPTPKPTPKPDPCLSVKNQLLGCQAAFNTCSSNLNTCNSGLNTCNSNLNTCNSNLGLCNANLNLAQENINQCSSDLSECNTDLAVCNSDLDSCSGELSECEAAPKYIFPGDGYDTPDSLGISGHGPALNYTDNGDGTFTDNNTGLMWEIKLSDNDAGGNCADATQTNRSAHCVNNTYTWSSGFTDYLDDINNTCDGAGTTPCTDDGDCGAGLCGLGGYQDWHIPNIKELMSLVDYSKTDPASSVPGFIQPSTYWSATTDVSLTTNAWRVSFFNGFVTVDNKSGNFNYTRAVRP